MLVGVLPDSMVGTGRRQAVESDHLGLISSSSTFYCVTLASYLTSLCLNFLISKVGIMIPTLMHWGFPGGVSGKEPSCQ